MSTTERIATVGASPDRAAPRRTLERVLRAGPALVVVSIILPALLFGLAAWQNWDDVRREAGVRVERTLRTLREHAVKVFETQKLVIDQVNGRLRYIDWQKEADRADLHALLASLDRDLDQVTTITVADAGGRLIASSEAYPADANTNFADRDWFRALRSTDAAMPFISRSYPGRQSGQPVFNVAGRIKSPDGAFRGAIAVSISRSYFETFYRDIEPSLEDVTVLVREDGQILARQPGTPTTSIPPGAPFFRRLQFPEGTAFEAKSALDDVVRLFAYRKVGTYPVRIGFALSKASIVAAWLANVYVYAAIAAVACIGLLAVSALAMRENRRERLATRRWQAAAAELRAEASERERIEAHLRQSQKMESVGHLTSGIAHDFNNMLGATIGSLDLLAYRMKANKIWDERAQRCVDNAVEGAWSAVNLTQRLLAFSRKQVLTPRQLNVNELIEGMSDLIRRSINEDVAIDTRLHAGIWPTYCDPNQLESALLNLIINARDAMPRGGRLTLSTQNREQDCVPGAASGRCVVIAVADTGAGMSRNVLARAFNPFFTTKEVGKGTGLGLSQVDGFVRQYNGQVTVESEVGVGSTVRIALPMHVGDVPALASDLCALSEAVVAVPRTGPMALALAAGEPGRDAPVALVVEDEAQIRRVSAEAFRQLGYRVLEAASPGDALSLLDGAPPLALLFTDVVMPEMNGAALAERVRRRQPGIRTLYTTGYARDAIAREGVLAPGVDVLGKPFTVDQLAAKVAEVLARPTRTRQPSAA